MTLTVEPDRRPEVLPSPKWVRVYFAGQASADSKATRLLRARGRPPIARPAAVQAVAIGQSRGDGMI